MGGRKLGLTACAVVGLAAFRAEACTRILYETGNHSYIVGRTMDWAVDPHSDLWSFPKGMERDGGVGPKSVEWTAKYGSVIASFDNVVTVDGMNEAGLVANTLYLVRVRLWRRRKIRQAADLSSLDPICARQFRDRRRGGGCAFQGAFRNRRAEYSRRQEGGGPSVVGRRFGRQRHLRISRRQARHPPRSQIYGDDEFAHLRPAARAERLLAGCRGHQVSARHGPLGRPLRAGELEPRCSPQGERPEARGRDQPSR